MLERINFMLGFLPWILFASIAGNTMHSLRIAIVVCLVTVLVFGFRHLKKGFILTWGTLLFFIINLIMIVFLQDAWVARHIAVLANGSLAAIAWFSLLAGRPFTLQYAREHVPEELWKSPKFIHKNRVITAVWGSVFLFSTATSFIRVHYNAPRTWIYQVLAIIVIQGGIAFTIWYPKREKGGSKAKLSNDFNM